MLRIRNPRDFWAGAFYVALALAVFWFGSGLATGSSARMGPGYFPMVLGAILGLLGLASVVRSFLRPGEAIEPIAWKPLTFILGATVLFGLLLERAGVVIALAVLIVVSAMASQHSRPNAASIAALVGIVVFCVLVFVKGLGVPMPLLGTWFGG
jgi:putative tricarboxylic transport membrane protein